jgi:hypothetical protein
MARLPGQNLLYVALGLVCSVSFLAASAAAQQRLSITPSAAKSNRCTELWDSVNASHLRLQDDHVRRDQVDKTIKHDTETLAQTQNWRTGLQVYVLLVETSLQQLPASSANTEQDRLWREQYDQALAPLKALAPQVQHQAADLRSKIVAGQASLDALDDSVTTEQRLFDHYVSEQDQCQAGLESRNSHPAPAPATQSASLRPDTAPMASAADSAARPAAAISR